MSLFSDSRGEIYQIFLKLEWPPGKPSLLQYLELLYYESFRHKWSVRDRNLAAQWKDFPRDLLSMVASAQVEMLVMRQVCSSWRDGYDDSVTKIDIGRWTPAPLALPKFCERFPMAIQLRVFCHTLSGADFESLHGSRLRTVTLFGDGLIAVDDSVYGQLLGLPLTCLKLSGGISLEGISALTGLSLLTDLALSSENLYDEIVPLLHSLPLRALSLSGCRNITEASIAMLQGLPLTRLGLAYIPVSADGFSSLQGFPALTELNLHGCFDNAHGERVTSFGALSGMPLTKLDVGSEVGSDRVLIGIRNVVIERVLRDLRGLPLASLSLAGQPGVTSAGLKELQELPLTELDLSGCHNISGIELLAFLPKMPLSALVLPSFSWGTDVLIPALIDLPLTSLDLNSCWGVSDVFLRSLCTRPLVKLRMTVGYSITKAGLESLRGLPLAALSLQLSRDFEPTKLKCLLGMKICDLSLYGQCRAFRNAHVFSLCTLPLARLNLWNLHSVNDHVWGPLFGMQSLVELDIYNCNVTMSGAKRVRVASRVKALKVHVWNRRGTIDERFLIG